MKMTVVREKLCLTALVLKLIIYKHYIHLYLQMDEWVSTVQGPMFSFHSNVFVVVVFVFLLVKES